MAHLERDIQMLVDVDVSHARMKLKHVIRDAQEANRELAQLQEKLDTLGGRLARFGIALEVGDE